MSVKSSRLELNVALSKLSRELDRLGNEDEVLRVAARRTAQALDCDCFGMADANPSDGSLMLRLFATGTGKAYKGAEYRLPRRKRQYVSVVAVEEERLVDIMDLADEAQFTDEFLEEHSLRTAIVCPVIVLGNCIGTIGVYDTAPRRIRDNELLLIESAARLAGVTISRVQAMRSLEAQNQLLATTMDCMGDPLAFLSADGKILQVNSGYERVFGYCSDEVRGRHFTDFFDRSDVDSVSLCLEVVGASQEALHVETTARPKYGPDKKITWSLTGIKSRNGTVETVVAVAAEEKFPEQGVETLIESGALDAGLDGFPELEDHRGERRQNERREFPYYQSIAPSPDGLMPALGEFFEVRCKDISPNGFAFFVRRPPTHRQFVVALGPKSSHVFLHAEVRHIQSCVLDGKRMYVVGCRYVGREKSWTEVAAEE